MFGSNSKKIVHKYDTQETLKLAINTVNENFGKFIKWLLKIILLTIAFNGVLSIISASYRNQVITQLKSFVYYLKISPIAITMLEIRADIAALLISTMFIMYSIIASWLMIKTIVGLNTGVKNIESKKVIIPKGLYRGRQFLVAVIATVMVVLTLLTETTVYFNELSLIPIYIFTFFINIYISFICFELASNGKDFSKAFSNAYVNLFYSKNHVLLKLILGKVACRIIRYLGVKVISKFLIVAYLGTTVNASLTVMFFAILVIIITIVYFTYEVYMWFVDITYTYLVYMLNEVKDKEVRNLK